MYAPKREQIPDLDEQLGRWIIGGLALIAIGAGIWYWQKRDTPADAKTETVAEQPVATTEPSVRNPIETPAAEDDAASASLPAEERIAALIGAPRFESMFVPEDIVRRLVTTVDNLPRQKVAAQLNPAKPPVGIFATAGGEDQPVLAAANYERYAPWIELVDTLDADAAVALYRKLYPQFQSAYEGLGNPDGYFNDRVIEVIDHLLATPEPPETIELVRPNVLYQFADPALESQSAGRKLLIRMGPGNAARIKMKLRDIRDRIAAKQ
jgi:hypothetical protein